MDEQENDYCFNATLPSTDEVKMYLSKAKEFIAEVRKQL